MTAIPLGINLSFCIKRWVTPTLWTEIVRDRLGLDFVQFSFDLVDPTWPDDILDDLARDMRRHADGQGIVIHSAFIGLAHYTFNQLLHPEPRLRDVAEDWLKRAYRFAASAGITRVGGPLGAIASRVDGHEADSLSDADYHDLIARMLRLGEAAADAGLTELLVEPTPMRREWPWTPEQAVRMAEDTASSKVPWTFCLDWGHGTVEPLYGVENARMERWYQALGPRIGAVHIQQTDFQLDRHWDFSHAGRVDPAEVAALQRSLGLEDRPVFLEVFYPFERDDASILDAVARSIALLKPAFA
ncbi:MULTISPECIES: TIM barrel protein [Rhodomicrobium]|uniref:sugar phosphate isomerase/epimerase family protein n=1 Tax=Rhodomicrobium TaxID=1068 RepID=UPI000B4C0E44|nr:MULTISPECIES: TIM barrel protein [Rhodomicrobium]